MASSSTRKQCANGDGCKQAAVTNCEGCSKAFCIKHFNDHRRLLDEEMNVIIDEHDHLKNSLNQQTTKPDSHSLIKEIDNWEKESIAKIQQRAKELRQELLQLTTVHVDGLSKKLQQLSEKLKDSRETDNFMETDLEDWKKTLYNLKTDLTSPSTMSINRSDDVSLVQSITLILTKTKESFERVLDNRVRIEENGQVAVRGDTRSFTEVRGKNEYTSGCHEIRLRIEQLTGDWILFGINSKSTPLRCDSYNAGSAYGWSGLSGISIHGRYETNKAVPRVELKKNDVITLIFDCDNCKMSMINTRTMIKHELPVDIAHCPFPWQLHVILYEPNSRVRIL